MTSERWSASNEILEACQLAIEERTNGRLSNLSVELVDEAIVVEARSETYHAVQLAPAAIHMFFDLGLTPRPELNRAIRALNQFLLDRTPKR